MVYLFLNADEYLLSQRLAVLKKALGDAEVADLNTTDLDGSSKLNTAEIVAQASMMPFLSERRLVLVRGYLAALDKRMAASKDTGNAAYQEAARLLDELPNLPDTSDLLLLDKELDKRRGLWKGFTLTASDKTASDKSDKKVERRLPGIEGLIKAGQIKHEELATPDVKTLPGWIQQYAKAQRINVQGPAVQLLADYVGSDLRRLGNELDKLAAYTGGQPITAEAVKRMVSDASEALIWELTDALSQRNGRAAMQALYELRQGAAASNSGNPFYLLTMIARQYRTILKVKEAMKSVGTDENAIAKATGENPYPVKKAMQQTGRYSFAELEEIFTKLLETDYAMKTGSDQDTAIDVLVAELTLKK